MKTHLRGSLISANKKITVERIPQYNNDNNGKELICIQMDLPEEGKEENPTFWNCWSSNKLLI